jgi:signal transduction histidine kinase
MEGLSPEDRRFQDLQQVVTAANRATRLTRQLLGFSRGGSIEMREIDPNRVVSDLARMVQPVFGAHIQFELSLEPEIGAVYADPGCLQQALLNLVLNARDAMPTGGRLSLKTERKTVRIEEGEGRLQPFTLIHVTDTGCGMSDETRKRIFEPFYATKETGKGTGLGLANVYEVVRRHGGLAEV